MERDVQHVANTKYEFHHSPAFPYSRVLITRALLMPSGCSIVRT